MILSSPPSAVLFDCDGVIIDSETPTFDLLIEDLARHGISIPREELETGFLGGTIELIGEKLRAAGHPLPEDWSEGFHAQMHAMLEAGVPTVPGVLEVFAALDRAGIPFAVASNGAPEKMAITLGQHGLLPRFRAVLSAKAIDRPKPAPDVYLAAARACGAAPEACVVIEDSPSGARAALAAGIRCFGFAPEGPAAVSARLLSALGVPLFHRMADLPRLLALVAAEA